jgi:HSP20 family protein
MLILDDGFRQLDRMAQQLLGTAAGPAAIPMDSWRDGDDFVIALDLPGVDPESIEVSVELDVLTVRAERKDPFHEGSKFVAVERPRGVFKREIVLGDALETENVKAAYDAGVLLLRIPVTAEARRRRIDIQTQGDQHRRIAA